MNPYSQGPLSVAIIVRNAEQALAETLESIAGLADEIVIVDTGSTDDTLQVAAATKARVFSQPWQDDFSAARNFAASQCTNPWILWLDAGERLSASAAAGLKQFVAQDAAAGTAYMLVIRLPVQGGEIAAEQIGQIRLVPNDPRIQFTGRVRETLIPALNAARIQVEGLPFRIERGRREHDSSLKQRRAKRNIQLAELEMREGGPQATLLNCLGDAFLTLGQKQRAAQFFHQAINASERGSSDMLAGYYGLVMALEGADQGRQGQLNACAAALEIFPADAQLLCAAGGYLQSLGQLDMALNAYQTAFRFGAVNPEVWHLDGILEVAADCYCQALQRLGRTEEARTILEAELAARPASARLRRQLLALYVHAGRQKEALAQVEHLPPETPYREALKSGIRGACLVASKQWIPAQAYLEASYRNGCRDTLCLEAYSLALLVAGDATAAAPVVAQWRQVDPHHPSLPGVIAAISEMLSPSGVSKPGTCAVRVDPSEQALATSIGSAESVGGR
jgi:tetratricopeptide (TPR) repeat protein